MVHVNLKAEYARILKNRLAPYRLGDQSNDPKNTGQALVSYCDLLAENNIRLNDLDSGLMRILATHDSPFWPIPKEVLDAARAAENYSKKMLEFRNSPAPNWGDVKRETEELLKDWRQNRKEKDAKSYGDYAVALMECDLKNRAWLAAQLNIFRPDRGKTASVFPTENEIESALARALSHQKN